MYINTILQLLLLLKKYIYIICIYMTLINSKSVNFFFNF